MAVMDAEPITILTPTAEIAAKVSPWPERAREVVITDQASFDAAAELLKGIKALDAEVHRVFDPLAEAAHLAHRKVTTERAAQLRPLEEAERTIKQRMSEYLIEQQRIQAEAERAAIAAAEAAAAAELEQQIATAEANGGTAREIEELIDTAPPIVVIAAPAVQLKGTGVSARTEPVAEVVNFDLLVKAAAKDKRLQVLLQVNEAKLRSFTKTMGAAVIRGIPGIRVTEKAVISARR